MQRLLLILVQMLALAGALHAQQETAGEPRKNYFFGYPIVYYLPETRWGFGASGFYSFYMNKADSIAPPSQLQFGLSYTLNNQLLFYTPFELYWKGNANRLNGELGFYKFSFNFFGVGSHMPDSFSEKYKVRFPRIRVHYLRKLKKNFYAGARYWFERYSIYETTEGGLLAEDSIPGSGLSITSGPGIVALYDSRDNVISARKGWFIELSYHNQSKLWGSNYWYDRYRIDLRKYSSIGKKNVIASQAFMDFLSGSVPFSQMANIGSSKRMRGYYEGKVRDKTMVMFQLEYRRRIGKLFSAVLFGSMATLAPEPSAIRLNLSRFAAGTGLRFTLDEQSRLSLRLDYALGRNTHGWYFTVNEAF